MLVFCHDWVESVRCRLRPSSEGSTEGDWISAARLNPMIEVCWRAVVQKQYTLIQRTRELKTGAAVMADRAEGQIVKWSEAERAGQK